MPPKPPGEGTPAPSSRSDDTDTTWRDWFPHSTPRPNQPDAIQQTLDTFEKRGFLSIEGACGTGKTIIALTGAVTKLRDPDSTFSRVVVATPLKNQMDQFVEELRAINAASPPQTGPIRGLTMVGFTDLHPYLREGVLDTHAPNDVLQDMRERTAELISTGSDVRLAGYSEPRTSTVRDTWYDPKRARHLCQQTRNMVGGSTYDVTYDSDYAGLDDDAAPTDRPTTTSDTLSTAGVHSPYPVTPPSTRAVVNTSSSTSAFDTDDSSRFDDYESGDLRDSQQDDTDSDDPLPADLQGPFDPFFAGYFAQDPELTDTFPVSFADGDHAVLTNNDLLDGLVSEGVCPHLGMSHLAQDATAIIANYYHVYDPTTRGLTQQKLELFNDETALIVDEAHNLESRAREMFSTTLAPHRLKTARNDVRGALQLAGTGDIRNVYTSDHNDAALDDDRELAPEDAEVRDNVRTMLDDAGISVHHLRVFHDVLDWIINQFIPEVAARHLDNQYNFSYAHSEFAARVPEFLDSDSDLELVDEDTAFDLESAGTVDTATGPGLDRWLDSPSGDTDGDFVTNDDALSNSIRSFTVDQLRDEPAPDSDDDSDSSDGGDGDGEVVPFTLPGILSSFDRLGAAATAAWEVGTIERDTAASHVGWALDTWLRDSSVAYYRELEVAFAPAPDADDWSAWTDVYTPKLALHNTIPADKLAEMSAQVGAGVFMSATLEPHDVFQRVSGLRAVADDHSRPTDTATYGLHFPKDNRASVIGALDRYTSDNRGVRTLDRDQMTATRRTYADVLTRIAKTHGNILIAMPSYDEADWLYQLLGDKHDEIGKPILKDESSSHGDTQELLAQFKDDDDQHRVLTTGLRGTVTEGVDYPGDRLHTVVVVGVPIANIGSGKMQSVKDAYAERFGEDKAFDYTFSIPAARKARQALGRVIRSSDDVGARVLLDERYTKEPYNSVHQYLSEQEREEFSAVSDPAEALEMFWSQQGEG